MLIKVTQGPWTADTMAYLMRMERDLSAIQLIRRNLDELEAEGRAIELFIRYYQHPPFPQIRPEHDR